ncbi:hypothetical protein U3516DRAFT_852039 [Neocallimastix sp. 'constans']
MRNIFLGSNNTRPPKEILYYWFEYLSITNRRYNYIKVISSNDTSTTYNDNYLVQDTPRQPNQTGSKKKYSSLSSLAQFHLTTEAVRPPLLNRQNSEYNRVVCACTNTGPYHFFYSVITCITKPYSIMLYYLPMFFHPTAADYNKNITTLLNEIIYPTNIVRTGSKVVNLYLFEDIKLKRWKNNRFLNLIDYFLIVFNKNQFITSFFIRKISACFACKKPRAKMCNDVWRGDAVLVCQYITLDSYICYGHNRRWILIMNV